MNGTAISQRLDEVLGRLDALVARNAETPKRGNAESGDAIDQVLAGEPRTTQTQSLREHETVQKFREEMLTGMIQLDTAHQLLGLVNTVLAVALAP